MATESPLFHDGAQTVSVADYRNPAQNGGTTFAGQQGSGQFLFTQLSTAVDRTVSLTTAAGARVYGVLQNKPALGVAADNGIYGVTPMIAGSTSIGAGGLLMSDTLGRATVYAANTGIEAVGVALEGAGTVGQTFTAFFFGPGGGRGTIA